MMLDYITNIYRSNCLQYENSNGILLVNLPNFDFEIKSFVLKIGL